MTNYDPDTEWARSRSLDPVDPTSFQWRWEEFPTSSIVQAVAEATGRDATTLPPLGDVVDPDGLNAVLTSTEATGGTVQVNFEYAGVRVSVTADGTIDLRSLAR